MSVTLRDQPNRVVLSGDTETVSVSTPGPQGPPGLTWRGAYAAGTTYAEDDVVSSGGSAWVSLAAANTGHTPASSPTWWSLLASKGDTGVQGEPGVDGTDGYSVLNGSREPDAGTGVNGDWYIDTATANLYLKTANRWSFIICLVGPEGEQGATGATGPTGPRPLTIQGEEPGALVDGTLATILCPQTGSLTAAGGLLTTGPTGTMTLTLVRGVSTLLTWTWTAGVTVAVVTGAPVAVTAGDSLSLVLAGSAGAVGLTYYATGAVS